mmetsp:Transcript_173760/g.556907  ORF Transcript_173760/g.556907 Transcript_173760/m.556907 type:complete len:287 (-) Transcript_173760:246-1106(-)
MAVARPCWIYSWRPWQRSSAATTPSPRRPRRASSGASTARAWASLRVRRGRTATRLPREDAATSAWPGRTACPRGPGPWRSSSRIQRLRWPWSSRPRTTTAPVGCSPPRPQRCPCARALAPAPGAGRGRRFACQAPCSPHQCGSLLGVLALAAAAARGTSASGPRAPLRRAPPRWCTPPEGIRRAPLSRPRSPRPGRAATAMPSGRHRSERRRGRTLAPRRGTCPGTALRRPAAPPPTGPRPSAAPHRWRHWDEVAAATAPLASLPPLPPRPRPRSPPAGPARAPR